MRHHTLVHIAVEWLKKQGCILALGEPGGRMADERPDAIGWLRDGTCMVIECKRTRKDFLAEWTREDRKQFRRVGENGMGHRRIYLAPPRVINVQDLEGKGWGLAVAWPGFVSELLLSDRFSSNRDAELRLILSYVSNRKHENKPGQLQLEFQNLW